MKPELIALDLDPGAWERDGEPEPDSPGLRWRQKEFVIRQLSDLLARSEQIRNPTRFLKEFINREKQSTTAVGNGLAIPHVRSYQPRELVVGVARCAAGVEYLAPDNAPVHLFVILAAPSYDDDAYLQCYRFLGQMFHETPWTRDALMEARTAHEIINIFRSID